MRKFILTGLWALMLIYTNGVFGQSGSGTIKGVVVDAVTREPLIGVNVGLRGTSIGAPTNIDGEFEIYRIPAGNYQLAASSIGYQTFETTVEVVGGETLEIEIELNQETVLGEEVVISAQAQGQRQAINEQLTAREIKNVVSSEKIRQLPDADAATAISRLPGISLENGDRVVIRGVQASQNVVMVNGIRLPSTDTNSRATGLGFISSNMLSGIEVTKALTPEMEASAIGGVVNLKLKEADKGLHSDFMLQGDYNTQDHNANNFQFWGSVSNRFLDDKLGVFAQLNARRVTGGGDIAQAGFGIDGSFNSTLNKIYGEGVYLMNNFTYTDQIDITDEQGGSLIIDYRLPNTKIVLQNTLALRQKDVASHQTNLNFVATSFGRRYTLNRDINENKLLINALQVEHDLSGIIVDYGVSRSVSRRRTDLNYGGGDFFFINQGFKPGDESTHAFPYSLSSPTNRRDLSLYDVFDIQLNEGDPDAASVNEYAETRDIDFDEEVVSAFANFTVPITLSNKINGKFKTGALFQQNSRSNDYDKYYARLGEVNNNAGAAEFMESIGADPNRTLQYSDWYQTSYDRGQYFLNGQFEMRNVINVEHMDQYIRLSSPGWAPGFHESDSYRDDFDGTETITAGYFQFDFNLGERLSVLTGARYEQYNMDFNGDFVFVTHQVDGLANHDIDTLETVNRTVGQWFPNLQAQFKATEWFDIRFAYTQSISRPNYNVIRPSVFMNARDGGSAGNPFLKPTTSENLDLYFSFHSNKVGLFTIGAFSKKMDDVFYGINRNYNNLPEGTWYPDSAAFVQLEEKYDIKETYPSSGVSVTINNPNPAYVKGLEFDWQTNFWYLPKPFNSLVFGINYTKVFSEMDYPQVLNKDSLNTSDPNPRRWYNESYQVDTIRTARLLQQGNDVLNFNLGYDYKGFSGRVSFRMQGEVMASVGNRPENDWISGNVYNWDFLIRQKLPIEGMSLFVNGINITHAPIKTFRRFRRDGEGDVERTLTQLSYYPRRFQLGIRYGF